MRYLISVAVAVGEIVAEVSAAECTASDSTTLVASVVIIVGVIIIVGYDIMLTSLLVVPANTGLGSCCCGCGSTYYIYWIIIR